MRRAQAGGGAAPPYSTRNPIVHLTPGGPVRDGDRLALATRRLHEAVGRPDGVRARLGRDPDGRAARRAARARGRPAGDGAAGRRGESGGPARGPLRRCVGRSASSTAPPDRGRRDPGGAPVLDPGCLRRRRPAARAAVCRRVPGGLSRGAVRRRLSGLRAVAHRGRSGPRGQQQARHELVAGGDRRAGPRRRACPADRCAVRDPRRRGVIRRLRRIPDPDPKPRTGSTGSNVGDADARRDPRGPAARPPAPGPRPA